MEILAKKKSQNDKRDQFGQRFLTDPKLVFHHNAWDNVEWDEKMEEDAKKQVSINSKEKLSFEEQEKYEKDAGNLWDTFYGFHENKFFKDRHWLFTEFPELSNSSKSNFYSTVSTSHNSFPGCLATTRMLEVGCGVGNTIFPILQVNKDPGLFVYGCDLSQRAVNIIQESPKYEANRCHVFVSDVSDIRSSSSFSSLFPFPPQSLDFIILIFVLSAIKPEKMQSTLKNLSFFLKPGGLFLFRDYGRYDMAQLRFKKGRCLEDNFYIRGDGTRVYFFLQEELRKMFIGLGLVELENYVDRRLQVNRLKKLKMFRVWVQCKYQLPDNRHNRI